MRIGWESVTLNKKILAAALAVAMVLTFAVTALAAQGGTSGGAPGDTQRTAPLTMRKMVVDGEVSSGIRNWLIYKGYSRTEREAILDDIIFELYESDEEGSIGENPLDARGLDNNGNIAFPRGIPAGWYLVKEVLGATAAEVFNSAGDMLIYFTGLAVIGSKDVFDYDALYTASNGYGGGYVLGYPGLNNSGDIFPIAVVNSENGKSYASFCAHAGSTNFAGLSGIECTGYMVAAKSGEGDNSNFLAAYSYIDAVYGDLDYYRVITQIVTWCLLGAIDVDSEDFAKINWDDVESGTATVNGIVNAKAIVEDVIENYAGYAGRGRIADLVYMICENPEHSLVTCQPQLVPIYGDRLRFENTPKPPPPLGKLKIIKEFGTNVDGDYLNVIPDGLEPESIIFTVTGPSFDADGEVFTYADFDDDGVLELKDLIPGRYTVEETGAEVSGYQWSAWYEPYTEDYLKGSVIVAANATSEIKITNYYDLGNLTIYKDVAGVLSEEDIIARGKTYTFTVTSSDYPEFSESFELPYREGEGDDAGEWFWGKSFNNLKFGKYVITETNAQISPYIVDVSAYNYAEEIVIPGNTITVDVDAETTVEFTNYYREQDRGSLTIEKRITGELSTRSVGDKTYTFTVTSPDFPEYSETVVLPGQDGRWSATIGNLLPGRYTVTEDTAAARISPYTLRVRANDTAGSSFTIPVAAVLPENAQNIVYFVNDYSYEQREPELGRLEVTKAFNVSYIPNNWSATITVTGPGGYNQSRTITGNSRVAAFNGLEPGAYTVTEVSPGNIPNYAFVSVVGEGSYDVTRGGVTQVTITNNYNEEEEPPDEEFFFEEEVPLGDFPPEEVIEDEPPPLGDMPKTGMQSSSAVWLWALFAAMLGVGVVIRVVRKTGKNYN